MLDFADFVGDGAEEVTAVAEKARIEFAHRIGHRRPVATSGVPPSRLTRAFGRCRNSESAGLSLGRLLQFMHRGRMLEGIGDARRRT
jgi:hypothetical protein